MESGICFLFVCLLLLLFFGGKLTSIKILHNCMWTDGDALNDLGKFDLWLKTENPCIQCAGWSRTSWAWTLEWWTSQTCCYWIWISGEQGTLLKLKKTTRNNIIQIDQRLGGEQDQLPCGPTRTSSGNCQEMKTCFVWACHAPQWLQSLKPSFRVSWRVDDTVVGRGNAGWTSSKSGRPCPCQNGSQWPHTEVWKRISAEWYVPLTTQLVKGLNWTTHWPLPVHTIFSDLDRISSSQQCQTVLTEIVQFLSN